MCGRFSRKKADKQAIAEAFHIHADDITEDFPEEADCAPGSMQPVVYETPEGSRAIAAMRWGFKLPDRLLFNTKSEGVLESRFWQPRFNQRCIIPANSFFEWKHNPAKAGAKSSPKPGPKYEISVPNSPLFGLAGLWSNWLNPKSNQWERTFSIFTSEPNELMGALHNRQPVILNPGEYAAWLTPSERPPLHLLRIFPKEKLEAHPIESAAKPQLDPIPTTGFLF
ncbi:MAG TPA: SOS response-associated peptidase [Acidobacteriaceae bacterium]